jgi:predicted Rossmann fold flavoprotein
MCALQAGQRGRSVLLIERNERLGKKILISGGGRCNFTNVGAGPDNFVSPVPAFCKSSLARYTPQDFIALVEKHGIRYHEKKLGQLFCDFSSKQIVEMLEKECVAASVKILLGCSVDRIEKKESFELTTNQGTFNGTSLVIATGGLSFTNLGASDFGYRIARQFDLKINEPRPGLVPLLQEAKRWEFADLSGISMDSKVSANGKSFRENILITHRGLSGPAILQISNYVDDGDEIVIDLSPDRPVLGLLDDPANQKKELVNVLGFILPKRFATAWCSSSKPLHRLSEKDRSAIAGKLHAWRIRIGGNEGYAKAEVTLGGVDPHELSSKSMESRKVPGLYFIGEVVDVTGWLGGYNFQWAWASAFACSQFV